MFFYAFLLCETIETILRRGFAAEPTCLPSCTGGWRWKIHKNKYLYQVFL